MTEQNADHDLNWLATQYALGELSPADHAVFEARLATDEAACLAVAEAVRLMVQLRAATVPVGAVALAATSSTPVPGRQLARRWAAAWVTVAMLTVAMAWFAVHQAVPPAAVELASTDLLARWTHAGLVDDADAWDDADLDGEWLDESLSAPNWLVQAVQLADESKSARP